jgi:bis(5'-nucleosyl)-tetraphosphatase (symmetrical)
VRQALAAAAEVERALRADDYAAYLGEMYGNEPDQWSESLRGGERLRFITNCFTRLRFCDARGRLALEEKGAPGSVPAPWLPWFAVPGRRSADVNIVFGHWSTLGLYSGDNVYALDSGCLWGGALSALRLDGPLRTRYSIACPTYAGIGG